ncbi:MAG: hypothetical protein U5K74_05410 [Gemmatimonadaceae bacterium]|nr:hypothetical protein [Gemmatimonadaceae bacterium]
MLISHSLAAQSAGPLRAHLDPARMRVGRDSFVVMMQGTPRGWQRLTMEAARRAPCASIPPWLMARWTTTP